MNDSPEIQQQASERLSFDPKPRNLDAYVQGEKVRTIHYGLGAIGSGVVRALVADPTVEIVGAIDPHPSKSGRDLGDVAGVGHALGVTVSYDADRVLNDMYADVVVHCTGSSLTEVYPQIVTLVSSEKSVISSCEELSYPWRRYPEISEKIDQRAREHGVRVLGTGVNPGFVMDLMPLMAATVSRQVKSVHVTRVVDTALRRIQLQRKTGAGLSVKGFEEAARGGGIGHVGLRESLFMIADTMGWQKLDDVIETLEPVTAKQKLKTEYFSVDRGSVVGLKQSVRGVLDDREVVRLELEMSLGAADPRDTIEIDGTPPVRLTVPGGIHGDTATTSIIANCVPFMAQSRATGLLTMRDLPAAPYYSRPRSRE